MSMISVRHPKKAFSNLTPLADVNCEIEKGEVISVIGPSGTGKSALIWCINRLEQAAEGEIRINKENILDANADIDKPRQRTGMVFRPFNQFSHRMIIENSMPGPTQLLGTP